MSIALERGGGGRMEAAGIVRGVSCVAVSELPDAGADRSPAAGALRRMEGGGGAGMGAVGRRKEVDQEASSCSSSIGKDSDSMGGSGGSDEEEDPGEAEVQSKLKGPLDATQALEEALPIRRGISKFYCGKSKSFTALGDISFSSCANDLAKPDNAYTRKRKNLLAFSINWDRRHSSPLRSAAAGGSVPKRPANGRRDANAAAAASGAGGADRQHDLPPMPPSNNSMLTTTPPQRCHFSVRSFSLKDLQAPTAAAPPAIISSDKLHQGLH